MSKKDTFWDQIGFSVRRFHRHFWPDQSVSCDEHNRLRTDLVRLQQQISSRDEDRVHLITRLRAENNRALASQDERFQRDLAYINKRIHTQASMIAEEMALPLRVQLAEVTAERDLLHRQSTHHGLTNLYNKEGLRQAFQFEVRRLTREWRRRGESKRPSVFAVMLDLDHFKEANDRLGHHHGDDVLQVIAELMRKHLGRRPGDLLGHPHGDEFVVILPDATSAYVQEHTQAFLTAVRTDARLDLRIDGLRITASIGVAVSSIDHTRQIVDAEIGVFLQELLLQADTIMYQAKRGGRNAIALSEDITHWASLG